MSSLENCLFRSLTNFFFDWFAWFFDSCMSYLYILEINPLLIAWFANIFSHSKVSLFIFFFMISFAVQNLWSLISSHWFIYFFISIAPSSNLKKILMWFMSKNVLPMFSCKSFIASDLTFRSLTYFGFIFVYGVRECFNFILLHVTVQHHLLKRLLFSIIFLPFLS